MRKAGSSYSIFHFECQHEIKFFVRILFSLSLAPPLFRSHVRERACIPLASFICCHCYFNNPKKQNINWILSIWNAKPKKNKKKYWNKVNVLFRILPLEMNAFWKITSFTLQSVAWCICLYICIVYSTIDWKSVVCDIDSCVLANRRPWFIIPAKISIIWWLCQA